MRWFNFVPLDRAKIIDVSSCSQPGGKLKNPFIIFGAAVLALTSCSATPPQSAPEVSVAPAASSPATPTPSATRNENERGQLIKEIGETATLLTDGKDAPPTMKFKVTSIKPITCDSPYPPQVKGTPIAVALEVETTSSFKGPLSVNCQGGKVSFEPYYWKGYAANGTRMNAIESSNLRGCLVDETKLLPTDIARVKSSTGSFSSM
jgi:hypothetical protein